jgi:hypothetical protein
MNNARSVIENVRGSCMQMSPSKLKRSIDQIKTVKSGPYVNQWDGVHRDYTAKCDIAARLKPLIPLGNSSRLEDSKKLNPLYMKHVQERIAEDLVEYNLAGGSRRKGKKSRKTRRQAKKSRKTRRRH